MILHETISKNTKSVIGAFCQIKIPAITKIKILKKVNRLCIIILNTLRLDFVFVLFVSSSIIRCSAISSVKPISGSILYLTKVEGFFLNCLLLFAICFSLSFSAFFLSFSSLVATFLAFFGAGICISSATSTASISSFATPPSISARRSSSECFAKYSLSSSSLNSSKFGFFKLSASLLYC